MSNSNGQAKNGPRRRDQWMAAVWNSDLEPTRKLVAQALGQWMDFDNLGDAYPGNETLAAMTGLHIRTVRRTLEALDEAGWVSKRSQGTGRGKATLWAGTIPQGTSTLDLRLRSHTQKGGPCAPLCDVKGGPAYRKGGSCVPERGVVCPPTSSITGQYQAPPSVAAPAYGPPPPEDDASELVSREWVEDFETRADEWLAAIEAEQFPERRGPGLVLAFGDEWGRRTDYDLYENDGPPDAEASRQLRALSRELAGWRETGEVPDWMREPLGHLQAEQALADSRDRRRASERRNIGPLTHTAMDQLEKMLGLGAVDDFIDAVIEHTDWFPSEDHGDPTDEQLDAVKAAVSDVGRYAKGGLDDVRTPWLAAIIRTHIE